MDKEYLKRLDKEDDELAEEYAEWQASGEANPEKIAGFRLRGTRSLVPELPCWLTAASIMSLLPLYETIFLPIYPHFRTEDEEEWRKIDEVPVFRSRHGLTPDEISTLAAKGRVIPYFTTRFTLYDEKIIAPIIQPGIPRLSGQQMSAFRLSGYFESRKKAEWENIHSQVENDFPIYYKGWPKECGFCIETSYAMGLRDYMIGNKKLGVACLATYSPASQFLDAVLQTECPVAREALSCYGGLPLGTSLGYVLEGLKVKYIPEMPLDVYSDVFDGNTAKALRKIVGDLLSDPLTSKYVSRLNAKIFDLNQEVEEIGEGRAAKVFEAVSDIAVYGGKKFIESRSEGYVRIPKKGLQRVAEWIASKGVDLAAKISKKDWALAQVYKARCKLKKCT